MAIIIHEKKNIIERIVEKIEEITAKNRKIDYIELSGNDVNEFKDYYFKNECLSSLLTRELKPHKNCFNYKNQTFIGHKIKFNY